MELGAWLTDASGEPIPLGNRGLARLEHADFRGLRPLPPRGAIVLTDVSNPLLGDAGAATVFGPQKGAGAEDLPILDQNLRRLARLLPVELDVPGAGAAGGTAFGLLAWGASLAPGSSAVGTALGLREAVRGADVVITGEGRFDSQSAAGKVPSHVLDLAREASVSALLVAGRIDAATDPFAGAVSLTDLAGGSGSAQATALRWLEAAGERLAAGVRR